MSKNGFIKLKKVDTTMVQKNENYNPYIEIWDAEYKEYCNRYGIYGINWYFTEFESIKYFDGSGWHIK